MTQRTRRGRVLVVDDHIEMARLLADQLGDEGYEVETAGGGEAALAAARTRPPDVVLTDLRMERVDGFDVLAGIKQIDPSIPVLIMTAFGAIDSAVEAIKRGAFHYLPKPFRLEEALVFVERAIEGRRLLDENRALRRAAAERTSFANMIGKSDAMRALYDLVERVAQAPSPALIRGESGTGKELIARALHFHGPRAGRPFIPVNCTALPDTLLESELFGHVRGAYTGATQARRGLFAEADGGTLFLDEIGDMAPNLQARLLRAIEDGEVRAVGADVARHVDVRVVAATHQDLEARVRSGAFRPDLFYRLDVVPIRVPPLRERVEDLPLLCARFFERAREQNPLSPVRRFAPDVIPALMRYDWPGNVRELENLVERLVVVGARESIELSDVAAQAPRIQQAFAAAVAGGAPSSEAALVYDAARRSLSLRQMEGEYIALVVERCGGNKTKAAEILGIDVSTIHRRERDK